MYLLWLLSFGGIEHTLICPLLQNNIFLAINQRHLFVTLEIICSFRYNGYHLLGVSRDMIAVYVYLALAAFNMVRHGHVLDVRLIRFIIKRAAQH